MAGDFVRPSYDTILSVDSITRPATTPTYTAGDVISEVTTNDHFTFPNLGRINAGARSGVIERAILTMSEENSGVALPDWELWLFHTDIAEVADDGVFAPSDEEMLTLVGVIAFLQADWKVGKVSGGNCMCEGNRSTAPATLPMVYKTLSDKLYGQLVDRGGYTPVANSGVIQVQLLASRD